ncbi:hypothetical protein KUCAC02_016492 [Chaenocephalus aceratus]|nr:hypothetical protein KUCAC02_016492 [Chaenocephalus aceratus]
MAMDGQQAEAMPELRVTVPIAFAKGGDRRSVASVEVRQNLMAPPSSWWQTLFSEVVTSLTKAILAACTGRKTSVSEESIRSSLGTHLPEYRPSCGRCEPGGGRQRGALCSCHEHRGGRERDSALSLCSGALWRSPTPRRASQPF